jgi:NADH:ubiquinone oxidoreductase subunit F (NADH-binding)
MSGPRSFLVQTSRGEVMVSEGPALLSGLADGPTLSAHLERYGAVPTLAAADLSRLAEAVDVRGRGGAGFPFARKVSAVTSSRGRPTVVVNLSEGEPASRKDAALALVAPHLVLDGAAVSARATGARHIHVVVAGEAPEVDASIRRALDERRGAHRRDGRDRGLSWTLHDADDSFVAGQSSAVLELIAGRENRPTTTWQPAAVAGHRGRPTLLSNGETFAHVGRLALLGQAELHRYGSNDEPGTTLLTVDDDASPGQVRRAHPAQVVEVPFGIPWSDVLAPEWLDAPVLLGGYHGAWASPGVLSELTVSRRDLEQRGLTLGAGIVLPLTGGCPVTRTVRIVDYLASQSAGRCGPCLNGLPALARALRAVAQGAGGVEEVERLSALVDGRGACAHPDGTVRLVRSMLRSFSGEVTLHATGRCGQLRTIGSGISA